MTKYFCNICKEPAIEVSYIHPHGIQDEGYRKGHDAIRVKLQMAMFYHHTIPADLCPDCSIMILEKLIAEVKANRQIPRESCQCPGASM